MKKIVALLMTAVMTIGMATAAFAAPSPQPTTGTIVGGQKCKWPGCGSVQSQNI